MTNVYQSGPILQLLRSDRGIETEREREREEEREQAGNMKWRRKTDKEVGLLV
jgi:hypothetical protein